MTDFGSTVEYATHAEAERLSSRIVSAMDRAADADASEFLLPPTVWLALCGSLMLSWVILFPISGDGDAVEHFANFRIGLLNLKHILHPWARPLYALVNLPAAYFGLLPSRLFHLGLSLVMCWQTYRYAQDLGLKRPELAIPFCAFQPFAFLLAGDTMTEMPFALVAVILLRLWYFQRYALFALLVGFTPLLRPEGFFFGLVMGLLFLMYWPTRLPIAARWATASLGTLGMLTWMVAGEIWAEDSLYFYHTWPWGTLLDYGSGSPFHYLLGLPFIIGIPFMVPWSVGTVRSVFNPVMLFPQLMWWIVLGVHSVMWAGGWMGSYGLLRIIACVTPCAGIVMLNGWNDVADCIASSRLKLGIGFSFFLAAANGAYIQNLVRYDNYFGCTTLALAPHLAEAVATAPWFFVSDKSAVYLAGLKCNDPRLIEMTRLSRQDQLLNIQNLPIGTVGLWDNHHGKFGFKIDCFDLLDAGFQVLNESTLTVDPTYEGQPVRLRGIVARKVE